ncbi:hypothetical protein [Nostoc punctiforme]|uniref:Uncharacterized protein n=1 Tax=Nostoc punctiforme (strain ATCC 29133 / PCC 73102) TaxID=63737 RepID=B2IYR4_NOSP7|nr:hypothetical protein [Nostoc punctiforme]ACC81647.1 hypothetical protein Npun_F3194 [Nostoc punctiforme PCC 73102]
MATLSNPTLSIDIFTNSEPNVSVRVDVRLTSFETFLIENEVGFQLTAKLVRDDGGLNLRDNDLFLFPTQNITSAGTYTFQSTVSYSTLNEDSGLLNKGNELFANFSLTITEQMFPLNVSISSPSIESRMVSFSKETEKSKVLAIK